MGRDYPFWLQRFGALPGAVAVSEPRHQVCWTRRGIYYMHLFIVSFRE